MDSWYKIEFSRNDVIAGKHMTLLQEVRGIFSVNGCPKDAAMFTNSDHSFPAYFFFSPGAVRIAKAPIARYAGVSCEAPLVSAVSLSLGDSSLTEIPFAAPPNSN
jgi:hypothetical protein